MLDTSSHRHKSSGTILRSSWKTWNRTINDCTRSHRSYPSSSYPRLKNEWINLRRSSSRSRCIWMGSIIPQFGRKMLSTSTIPKVKTNDLRGAFHDNHGTGQLLHAVDHDGRGLNGDVHYLLLLPTGQRRQIRQRTRSWSSEDTRWRRTDRDWIRVRYGYSNLSLFEQPAARQSRREECWVLCWISPLNAPNNGTSVGFVKLGTNITNNNKSQIMKTPNNNTIFGKPS